MTTYVFHPYRNGLNGLRLIKQRLVELGEKVIEVKTQGSRYRPKPTHKQIRWGVPKTKVQQYQAFAEANVPHSLWTQDRNVANEWYQQGHRVLCRTVLNGHGGAGITVAQADKNQPLVDAPLYVLYTKKQREFRVHVVNGYAQIYVREKKRVAAERRDMENYNPYIRNHDNGWVFTRFVNNDAGFDVALHQVALEAVGALGLDFGAVDIGYSEETGFNVYEVNTAPGCDNKTSSFYAHAFSGRVWNQDAEQEQDGEE